MLIEPSSYSSQGSPTKHLNGERAPVLCSMKASLALHGEGGREQKKGGSCRIGSRAGKVALTDNFSCAALGREEWNRGEEG